MGRPPIGKRAMTAAERQRRHRAHRLSAAGGLGFVTYRFASSSRHVEWCATLYELLSAYAQVRLEGYVQVRLDEYDDK